MFMNTYAGWWLTYPSEKYEFVNGKDDIPYMKWKIKNVPSHQPGYIVIVINHIYGSFSIAMLNNQRVYSYRFPSHGGFPQQTIAEFGAHGSGETPCPAPPTAQPQRGPDRSRLPAAAVASTAWTTWVLKNVRHGRHGRGHLAYAMALSREFFRNERAKICGIQMTLDNIYIHMYIYEVIWTDPNSHKRFDH